MTSLTFVDFSKRNAASRNYARVVSRTLWERVDEPNGPAVNSRQPVLARWHLSSVQSHFECRDARIGMGQDQNRFDVAVSA